MSQYEPSKAAIDFSNSAKVFAKELIEGDSTMPYSIIQAVAAHGAIDAAMMLNVSKTSPDGRKDFAASDLGISPITLRKYKNGGGLVDPEKLEGVK